MPSKYIVREFEENAAYHIFNRGINRQSIFLDKGDYLLFLRYLEIYLCPLDKIQSRFPYLNIKFQARNLNKELELLAYCLMPNHFHLLLFQKTKDAISKLMRQLSNAYTKIFNEKYDRSGNLFEGRFKAAAIKGEDLLLHVSRYIHLNPAVGGISPDAVSYDWSSLRYYFQKKSDFINTELILSRFRGWSDYKKVIDDQEDYGKQLAKIKKLTIENPG